ncbi:MAG: hydantoinase B/oxoprolinase family protein [Pseudomonadota bacterium]|nr:hydantoinase B/oxoprolinase family protein [Pseudomonadota bacterium]
MASSPQQTHWQFWIDRGGTFTDIVALTPDQQVLTYKLLSENPGQYADAAVEGIKRLQNQHCAEQPTAIASVRMGTTVATNALLERKGEPTVLLISKGLRDQLEIGYQTRPDIFASHIDLPRPLYDSVYEVAERVQASGVVEYPLDEEATLVQLQEAYQLGFRSVAVVLMHAYRYPSHEKRIREIAQHVGFQQISLSHEVSPLVKIVPRGHTTVADAYLSPVLRHYVNQVAGALSDREHSQQALDLQFMQSNGGLAQADVFQGRDAILSGPAGGVVGMVRTAEADGFDRIVGFDMGGTSTDVSHYAGELERETETVVNGVRLRVPMMNIHTVAAGGGSIVQFADGRLQVGPDSAGAYPGPACYRNGGPLTVTDCNVLLGRIQPQFFPSVFGPQQDAPLDLDTVRSAFTDMAEQVTHETGVTWTAEQLAEGFLTIAVENMAAAVKKISVERGYDVQDYILSAFGGAGGQHACAVAKALNMRKVYLHPMAGVLSAYGIGIADQRWLAEEAVEQPLDQSAHEVERIAERIEATSPVTGHRTVRVYLRYEGSDTPLLVSWNDSEQAHRDFEQQHRQLFGFIYEEKSLLLDAVQVEVVAPGVAPPSATLPDTAMDEISDHGQVRQFIHGQWQDVAVYRRETLPAGFSMSGPALLIEANSTIFVEPSWQLDVLESGALLLSDQLSEKANAIHTDSAELTTDNLEASASKHDPVTLEIFNHLFMSVAEQMGYVLEKTASSVNIKERLDFSCAVFDSSGALVANAPHIPVHLGSMSESIEVVIREHTDMQPGDAFVLNTPYNGGTHLPDVTVIKPVFINSQTRAGFYVAARGHHADIGGITPGSMPADSQHIEEEGVILDNLVLMRAGEFQEADIRKVLASAKYPARNPDQNIADLMAQLASCEKGAEELKRLCQQYGADMVHAYMQHVQDNAEAILRECLAELPSGTFRYDMDDGTCFRVAIEVDQVARRARVDFTGTGYTKQQPMHPGNFNAPTSVVRAAVLYCFRVLVRKNMPLNAGFFRALDIVVPERSIISPEYPAAVVSGNVETAQALVDCLMGALGLMSAGQGTNNNFTFGNESYQYYETLCGGAGATADGRGADAVHTHMTNSRLTDPEILEQRFPVLLDHFHIRQLSGGQGTHRGGNGVERHIRFLEPMTANIISGHRRVPTFALNGAGEGKTGVNFIHRNDGRVEWLDGCARTEMDEGDTFCIHTPGGGGWREDKG